VSQVKIAAFTLSSFIAGVAGVMSAYNFGSVSANNYDAITGLGIIAFAYLGGVTMVSGAIIASLVSVQALVPHLLQQEFGISGEWALLIGAVLLISNLVFYPEGIAGSFHGNMTVIRQKRQELIGAIRGPALAPAVGGGVPKKPGKDAGP
jgi:branched-chain amino acid transport system permease protein